MYMDLDDMLSEKASQRGQILHDSIDMRYLYSQTQKAEWQLLMAGREDLPGAGKLLLNGHKVSIIQDELVLDICYLCKTCAYS